MSRLLDLARREGLHRAADWLERFFFEKPWFR